MSSSPLPDSANASTNASNASHRGRGRGKSRGGLGKYLRARGRGRGRGRPAQFTQRLVLEGEEVVELDEEEQKELEQKYARRQLGTNADRYAEPEAELDSEGEEIVEPEVDLSAFLERQRLAPESPPPDSVDADDDESDVDTTLSAAIGGSKAASQSKKGRVQQVEWDAALEEMSREKAAADATRAFAKRQKAVCVRPKSYLKSRFRAQTARQRGRSTPRGSTISARGKPQDRVYVEAPPLPTETEQTDKSEKDRMQDFLDGLLN